MKNVFKVGDPLFKIDDTGLIKEYYYIGMAKMDCYAIYADKSGHFPIRVYIHNISPYFYLTLESAVARSISRSEHLIEILKGKYDVKTHD